jgi:hypothetical protein
MRVTNGIPLGCSLLLLVGTVNCVQTRKVFLPTPRRRPAGRAGRARISWSQERVSFKLQLYAHWYGARFRQKFTLEDAIGSHACSLEANTRVTNGLPLGSSLLLPVDTVNCVQTLKE